MSDVLFKLLSTIAGIIVASFFLKRYDRKKKELDNFRWKPHEKPTEADQEYGRIISINGKLFNKEMAYQITHNKKLNINFIDSVPYIIFLEIWRDQKMYVISYCALSKDRVNLLREYSDKLPWVPIRKDVKIKSYCGSQYEEMVVYLFDRVVYSEKIKKLKD